MENPSICAAIGIDPYGPPPSLERYSAFLSDTANDDLQMIRRQLMGDLIEL